MTDDTGSVQVRVPHLNDAELREEFRAISAERPTISDAAAVTIAARWQSPAGVGSQLASFASGAPVNSGELLEDALATYDEAERLEDQQELIALALWVAKHSLGYTRPQTTRAAEKQLHYRTDLD